MREHLDVLAVGLGDIVALLVVLSPAFLPGVIHSAAALRILGPALLLVISLLQCDEKLVHVCCDRLILCDLNLMLNTRMRRTDNKLRTEYNVALLRTSTGKIDQQRLLKVHYIWLEQN